MGKIMITKNMPTVNELMISLSGEFNDGHEYTESGNNAIIVKKNAFIGARISINYKKNSIVVNEMIPSAWVRMLLGGLLLYAFIYTSLKDLKMDVQQFIEKKYA